MSRKVPEKSFSYDSEAEEKETQRKGPPGLVPCSNPNEVLPTNSIPTQGPSQREVSSARRYHDASPGAEALSRPRLHPSVFVEETRPGAISMPGINNDGLTIEEGYDDQETIASHEKSTVHVIATAVDTEEESRIRHQRDQFQHERDHFRHERDQLRHILDNTVVVVVTPIVTTDRDEENGDESIHADNHDGLPRSDGPKCGTRGRRWFAMSAILVIAVAVVVTLALVLPSEPNPNPTGPATSVPTTPTTAPLPEALSELLSSVSSGSLTGTIPTEIGMLSDYLVEIDLFGNGLTGPIPSEIGQLTKLTSLSLWNNTLTGMIPSEIGMLSDSLGDLSLSLNELEGTIPSEVGQLTELTWLDLSDNTLDGTIPSEINILVDLVDLWLYGNIFTGTYTCPESIDGCRISCDSSTNDTCRSL